MFRDMTHAWGMFFSIMVAVSAGAAGPSGDVKTKMAGSWKLRQSQGPNCAPEINIFEGQDSLKIEPTGKGEPRPRFEIFGIGRGEVTSLRRGFVVWSQAISDGNRIWSRQTGRASLILSWSADRELEIYSDGLLGITAAESQLTSREDYKCLYGK